MAEPLPTLVEPLPAHFWREVIRRRVKPIYHHPSLIAKGSNLPALREESGTISDGDDHTGTVNYG